jgi:hypothetical protein
MNTPRRPCRPTCFRAPGRLEPVTIAGRAVYFLEAATSESFRLDKKSFQEFKALGCYLQ